MWIKPAGNLKWFPTLKDWLDDRINRYNKYWYKNNAKDFIIRSHYCKSRDSEWNIQPWGCEDMIWWYWIPNFNAAVLKLNI